MIHRQTQKKPAYRGLEDASKYRQSVCDPGFTRLQFQSHAPEPFLGDEIKAARGTTNQHGVAVMEISSELNERGVHSGFYRIRVSKKSAATEQIPARYNEQTQLGIEVEPVSPESRDASFNLAF